MYGIVAGCVEKKMAETVNFAESCFVIMPYGEREVAGRKVDFDQVYGNIFRPAVRSE